MSTPAPSAIHFLSGLPRSGSTLLTALLRQNPRFHADITSPLYTMVTAMAQKMSDETEYGTFFTDARRQAVMRGLFESYYRDAGAAVVFDNNRGWCGMLPALAQLFPQTRVIACVREVAWIIDSFERILRRNPFRPTVLTGFKLDTTVYTRANGLASPGGSVGFAYESLKEAFYGEHAGRLMLLQYETLTRDPDRAMAAVYRFLGEPVFEHDFERVEFEAPAFDERMGAPGMHRITGRVRINERPSILPPDLIRRCENDSFWRDPGANPHGVLIV